MPQFSYEIYEAAGPLQGTIEAADLASAAARLRDRGSVILDLAAAGMPAAILHTIRRPTLTWLVGPATRDIASFTEQLAVMIRAGISIRAAIEGISEQADHPGLKKILLQMRHDIETGKPFSESLAAHPECFSPLYINMIRASEMTGGFPEMLDRICGYLRQQIETRNLILGAMTYPAMIALMAVATTIFLLMSVLPRFMVLFAGKEAVLPASTKLLMALSAFLCADWPAILIITIGLGWGLFFAVRTDRGRVALDRLKLSIPVLHKMFSALYLSRGLQTMGQLVNAGVPILDTLAITSEVSGNILYRRMWRSVYGAVKGGQRIAIPLQSSTLLPRAVVQMISAGEESGRLGPVLDEVSDYYARELKSVIKTVTSLIEPGMIVTMGGIVGFIASSIILPIFKLSQIMGR